MRRPLYWALSFAALAALCFGIFFHQHPAVKKAVQLKRNGPLTLNPPIAAASCSATDVQAAFNAVTASTAVVMIPSCPAGVGWASQVTLTVPSGSTTLSILGAGSLTSTGGNDQTVIVDNFNSGSPLLAITTASTASIFRLAGITFKGGTGGGSSNAKFGGIVTIAGSSQNIRMDHSHFNASTYNPGEATTAIQVNGQNYGVIDHNVFDAGAGTANQVHYFPDGWNGGSFGDGSWADASTLGSNRFIFLEDNIFNNGFVNDNEHGGRMVIRHNIITGGAQTQTHGLGQGEGRFRAGRAMEFYGNTLSGSNANPTFYAIWAASGTWMVWGNTANTGYENFILIPSIRHDQASNGHTQVAPPNGWGYCGTFQNGTTSAWDGNSVASSGYPCMDQTGRGVGDLLANDFPSTVNTNQGNVVAWPRQKLEPVYEWLDNWQPVPGFSGALMNSQHPDQIAPNRDFFQGLNNAGNGTVGTGVGVFSARPATCTPGAGGTFGQSPTGSFGVGYWATDQQTLYICTAANTWTSYYTPFTYPHPLTNQLSLSPSPVAFGSQIDGTTSAAITVTVTNTGTGTVTLASPYFSIAGTNSGDFTNIGTGTCSNNGTIGPSASCTVNVTFKPVAAGSRSASLTILGDSLGAVSLTGTGIAVSPTVSLNPTSLAFGSITTGTSSGAQTVTLTNTGTASLSITSIALTGANANQFSTNSNTCGASLAVNASCSVKVVFSPTAVASDTANLTFTTNASTSPDNVSLTGSGVAPVQPSLSISPSPAAFGNQFNGTTSSPLTVTITNSGPGTQTFATPYFVISGTNASDFAQTGGTCSNGGTLGNGSCTIILTFTPGATGARSGILTINGTASITDSLTGTGTAPAVSLNPTSIAFGNQTQGTSSGNKSVTLTNSGTGPLAITSIVLTGANASDFSTNSSTCGSSLAAAASCSLNVVFSPTVIASETASLTFTTNASTSPDNVSLTGTGIAVTIPVLSFSPSPGAFGNQLQGTTSTPLTITVSNIGTAPEVLSTPYWTISGANATSFANAGTGTCANGGTIAVSGSCTVNLRFTPSTTGALAGTLTINGTTIASDSLTGTGVAPVLSVSPSPAAFGNQAVNTTSSPLTVTLSNTGTASEVLSTPYFTITGVNAADYANAGTGSCANGGTVAVSGSCTVNLTFTPSATGGRAATLNFLGTLSTSDSLSGTGTAPLVSLNPTSIAFGNQTTGTTSGNHAVTLTNTGNASLTITSITLTGANSSEFGTNGSTCGASLAASASCSINVTFSPATAAAKSASLTFTTSAASSPNNVSLTGTGVVPAVPALSLSPSPGAFGNQNVGTTSTALTITVTNTGNAVETLSTPYFTLTGMNPTNFANANSGTCANGGSISISGSCTINLTFTPASIGALTATLNVNGTASASDALTGTGISGVVSLSPTSLNFGNQNNGTSSNNSAITLTNTGAGVLTITSITVTGTNATEFSTNSNTCGATLAASASCTVNAVFSPVTAGSKSASVTFTTNAATSPDNVTMIGTGLVPSPNPTPAPAITIVSILPPGSVVLTSGSFVASPRYTTITPQGCSTNGVNFQNPCLFSVSCGNCSNTTAVRWNGVVVSQKYKNGVITASVPLSLIPIPTVSTDYSLSLSN